MNILLSLDSSDRKERTIEIQRSKEKERKQIAMQCENMMWCEIKYPHQVMIASQIDAEHNSFQFSFQHFKELVLHQ